MDMILGVGILLAVAAAGWFVYACAAPTAQFFKPVLVRGPSEGRKIALTFDDGPAPPFTGQILDILREKNVSATFFVCGENVERYPQLVKRIAQEGHSLGNHTFSHPFLYFRSPQKIAGEIDRTQAAILKAAGVQPEFFRPPYGARWLGLMKVLRQRGLRLVMWSATGYDWKYTADAITDSAMRELAPGAVVLLHDGRGVSPPDGIDRSPTVRAVSAFIDRARAARYEFVSLCEFLRN